MTVELNRAGEHAPGSPVRVELERPAEQLVVRVVNGAPREASRATGGGFELVGT
jgi:hypothetical protein